MLPVAAATLICDGTGWFYPPGSSVDHLEHASAVKPFGALGDLHHHRLAGESTGDEDHLVIGMTHDGATMGDALEGNHWVDAHTPTVTRPGAVLLARGPCRHATPVR